MNHSDRQYFLRISLKANAAFSAVSGLVFSLASGPVAAYIGFSSPGVILAIGLGLLGFAAHVLFVATRPSVSRLSAMSIVAGDVLWVAGSGVLVWGFPEVLNGSGRTAVLAVAIAVLTFADCQAYGLWRSRRN